MSSALFVLLAVLGSRPGGGEREAELAYQRARQSFYALKADSEQRKDRGRWLAAAARFEAVAAHHPHGARAAEALFTAAELRSALARLSFVAADRRAALGDYRQVAKLYPKSSLADDALFQAARIELDREDDPTAARADLDRLIERYPKGDMVRRARALLAALGPAPKAHAVARGAKATAPVATNEAEDGPADGAQDDAAAEPSRPSPKAVKREQPSASGVEELRRAGAAPGGIPLSVQMGLSVRRVVIDAGHGGHDTGAIGPGGTREKDVTLAIARKLAERLRRLGLTVLLTRDGDRFVPLEGRAQFANQAHADLFISIHANANADPKQRGVETFFLDVTSDRYAIRLAARENQSPEDDGFDGRSVRAGRSLSDLQFLLADLATRSHVEESRRLADRVQQSLVERSPRHGAGERDLGVKHALFYVLLGTRMPSILVETAFVSNPTEERRLRSPDYQDEVARGVAAGVERFLRDRRELAGL